MVDRDWREGIWGRDCLMGTKFQFFKMKSSEEDVGDGYIII